MSTTVTLTIDGKEVTVPKGTLIIRAAEQLGIVVPRFCDHPLLEPAGACRQCIVEVEKAPKPVASCTIAVADGMVVRTHLTSDMAAQAQQAQLEFLLLNHPLDCPMCDKGGECPLQDQALAHGPGETRFVDQKRRYDKPVAVSSQILLDRERCVLCARCTRFANQIAGDPFIEMFERGALQQVAIYEDEPYESYFSGNVIQICPVGALTSKTYRFRARPFDVTVTPSVCTLCSAGCAVDVHVRNGEVQRINAGTDMAVNEMWLCDKGRFGFAYLASGDRVTTPLIRGDRELVAASWPDALQSVVDRLRGVAPDRVAVITGGRLPDADAYALSRFARTVLHTDQVFARTRDSGPDEDRALAALQGLPQASYDDVEAAPIVVVVGLDSEEEVPILHLRIRKAWRDRGQKVVTVGARAGSLGRYQWRRLPTPPGAEAAALAALARMLGASGIAEYAAATLPLAAAVLDSHDVAAVADALRHAQGTAVVLVGDRAAASPGVLAAAARVAQSVSAKVAWVPRRSNLKGALAAGLTPGALPGWRRSDDDDDRRAVSAVWGDLPATGTRCVSDVLRAAADGAIDVLYLVGVDLAGDADDPALARAALRGAGTVVVQDLFTNATTGHADIVLPVTATYERQGTTTDWEGRTRPFRRALAPPPLALDDWEVTTRLAASLGTDLGWHDRTGLAEQQAALGARTTTRPIDDPVLPTLSGSRVSDTTSEPGAGLTLVTYPLLIDRGTLLAGATDLAASAHEAAAALHPDDATRLGISDGTRVKIGGPDRSVEVVVRLDGGTVPGSVFVPRNATDPCITEVARPGARVEVEVVP